MSWTEGKIITALDLRYSNNIRYKLSNAYIFKDWETDFFVQQYASHYCYEIEIKISRSDFFADLKKTDKHSILQTGTYQHRKIKWNDAGQKEEHFETKKWTRRPNKFYYCVPEGLISVTEIPTYAGLMYVGGEPESAYVSCEKEAPFIHRDKLDLDKALCKKFYFYWRNEQYERGKVEQNFGFLKERHKELLEQTGKPYELPF